ncbi:MAG: AAA family ATPase [Acidimicrobiales bacterium]|nr:AAA family ATPase [Acidimicrobiales bacterium]
MADEPRPPKFAETHISWVLLSEDRAFKVAKPVVTDVLDQGDVEGRRASCEREVRLNARLSPDVYLGVGSIQLDGEDLEPVIVMRRMPEDRRLSSLLDSADIGEQIRAVARAVASFHASTDVLAGDAAAHVASEDALVDRWREDITGVRDVGGPAVVEHLDRIERLALDYLAGRGRLLAERIEQGMVRDGHGDLLADDVFCLADGPRILDCLAFSDDLRCGDVLADVAFLVMDLQRLGHPELARGFLRAYCEFSDEHHPGSLAHLYVAQRALVRAKVSALRHAQEGDVGQDVTDLLDLALDHLERATVQVALVGGLPGSGKSTVAGRLADEFGWVVLSSDEIRRDLGLRYEDLQSDAAYDPETVARVYDEMRRRADQAVRCGMSVALDATWSKATEREAARAVARDAHATLLELRCTAPPSVCRDRVERRTKRSHSEATPRVVDVLADRTDPWPEAVEVDTDDVGSDAVWQASVVTSSARWWTSRPASSTATGR